MSASNYTENAFLDHSLGTSAWAFTTGRWMQVHTGDPGEDGTANVAGETTRVACTYSAASGGIANLASVVTWTSVSTTELWTHFTIWDDPSAGNCRHIGTFDPQRPVTAGDDVNFGTAPITVK